MLQVEGISFHVCIHGRVGHHDMTFDTFEAFKNTTAEKSTDYMRICSLRNNVAASLRLDVGIRGVVALDAPAPQKLAALLKAPSPLSP